MTQKRKKMSSLSEVVSFRLPRHLLLKLKDHSSNKKDELGRELTENSLARKLVVEKLNELEKNKND